MATVAVGCAVVLAFVFKTRTPASTAAVVPTDPKAVVESASGQTVRVNREQEQVRIGYDRLLAYGDGSTKMMGVKVVTERAGGRVFTLTGKEGQAEQNESVLTVVGDVTITASDGLTVRSDRATFAQAEGLARMPGAVEFSKGRLHGASKGMVYDKNADVLTLLEQPVLRVTPQKTGGGMDVAAGGIAFDRRQRIIQFDRGMKALRPTEVIEADSGLARLAPDTTEDRLEVLELRGNARILAAEPALGAFERAAGQNIDVKYGPDGETIEHVAIAGSATLRLAGERGRPGAQIVAESLDVTMAPDGSTPVALRGTRNVQMTLPEDPDRTVRTIRAEVLEASGEASRGLTGGRFSGNVEFRERRADMNRTTRSEALDLALGPGLQSIDDAKFARSVQFMDGSTSASAARARYVLAQDRIELAGSEPGRPAPRVVDQNLTVEATAIDMTPSGPNLQAKGTVKSELHPEKGGGKKTPSMLKRDQPVIITAESLSYDGAKSTATYEGNARLSQGDTTVRGATITLNQESGDLQASGSVVTTTVLDHTTKEGKKERAATIARSKDFTYQESAHLGTYTDDAQVSGSHGDLRAKRVELHLKPTTGQELDRLEAYEDVVLVEQHRKTTGARLTYFADEERYQVTGAPMTVLDECDRETTGRTLTFDKATDRIVVDGRQMRTRTIGAAQCP
jgi:lipopolysaccharide export system protein LptA